MALKRDISTIGLLFTSLSCMIGSGWLFGAFFTAKIAGPASIISWLIGGLMIVIISLVFAELSAMIPLAGGIARFTQFSHGTWVSFTMTWLSWLSSVAVAPTEVLAILQYYSKFFPEIINSNSNFKQLTPLGLLVAAILLAIICWINIRGVEKLAKYNIAITSWKLAIPILSTITILSSKFSIENFYHNNAFLPYGWHSIWESLPAAVVFSFLGFREATSLAGETKNPAKSVPIAVIGSVLICTTLYILIQIAFIGSLSPEMLIDGWKNLHFSNDSGPFAGIAISIGVSWLGAIIYADSFITPAGTSIIYTATCSRLNYAMSKNKYAPASLSKLNKKNVPQNSIILNCIIGMLIFFPLPDWEALIKFQTIAIVLSYSVGPICLIALREQAPQIKRPFKIPMHKTIAYISFFFCNVLAYWSGWETMYMIMIALIVGWALLISYKKLFKHKCSFISLDLIYALWLAPYFLGIILISWLGNFGGGQGIITPGWDYILLMIFSYIAIKIATKNTQNQQETQNLLAQESLIPFIINNHAD